MIKTWQQRCEEHPDHEGIVSNEMIQARMQEEIDELRERLAQPERGGEMNERIRELAEQAGSTHKQSLGVYQFFAHELGTFAELVVQDEREACADIADQHASAEGIAQRIAAEIRRRE